MADDDFDADKVLNGSDEPEDTDTDVDEPDTDTSDDDEGGDEGSDDVESWDAKRGKAELSKRNKENQRLRERLRAQEKLTAEERAELEELRSAKMSEQEKLEARATKGEQTAAELRAQNEELRLRAKLGLPEPDDEDGDDPFLDIPLKGETFEERQASALRFAEKYGIGKFAKTEDEAPKRQPKTPPVDKLRRPSGEDDSETDPAKLAERVSRNKIGLLI